MQQVIEISPVLAISEPLNQSKGEKYFKSSRFLFNEMTTCSKYIIKTIPVAIPEEEWVLERKDETRNAILPKANPPKIHKTDMRRTGINSYFSFMKSENDKNEIRKIKTTARIE